MSGSSNFSAARPKRAGFARTHVDATTPSTKKPRFDPRNPSTLAAADDEEVDPVLEADEIGKGAGLKRNAVNIDGYDSDSSQENFDARAEAKSKSNKAPAKDDDDDDDEDMFAASDKEEDKEEGIHGGKKKPEVRFLENHEIEGQDETSKAGGKVSVDFGPDAQANNADSDSESGGDELRDMVPADVDEELGAGHKKKYAPKVDAFNMRSEQEEGRFDEAGNFVRAAFDPDAAQDAWLDGVSKKDIKRAKEAHEKREAERKERERAEDSIATSEVLSSMITYLEVGETPIEALARHGKAIPKKKVKNYNKNKKSQAMDIDVEPDPAKHAAATKAKEAIDAITECASRLTDRGVDNIYELPRESIMRQYKRDTGEDWKNPNPTSDQWEFHWLTAPEGDINGPYDTDMMRAWEANGQFEAGAEFRRVGETEWSRVLDFDE
jgi:CD2 antigen cytoplasmic tail-binding protein 2